MDIAFKSKKQTKIFNSQKEIQQNFGKEMARKISMRLVVLRAAPTLAEVPHTPPEKRHELKGKRKGQFAITTKEPYRIIFEPNHDPIPRKEDGGIDLSKITAIKILEVEDYH